MVSSADRLAFREAIEAAPPGGTAAVMTRELLEEIEKDLSELDRLRATRKTRK